MAYTLLHLPQVQCNFAQDSHSTMACILPYLRFRCNVASVKIVYMSKWSKCSAAQLNNLPLGVQRNAIYPGLLLDTEAHFMMPQGEDFSFHFLSAM